MVMVGGEEKEAGRKDGAKKEKLDKVEVQEGTGRTDVIGWEGDGKRMGRGMLQGSGWEEDNKWRR